MATKIITIILSFILFARVASAEVLENFDNLLNGSINGQNGWSVQNMYGQQEVTEQGCLSGKCLKIESGVGSSQSYIYKSLTPIGSGYYSYYFKSDNYYNADFTNFYNENGTSLNTIHWGMETFGMLTNDFYYPPQYLFGYYVKDIWNKITVQYDKENSRYRAKVQGGNYFDWVSTNGDDINQIQLIAYGNQNPDPYLLDQFEYSPIDPEEIPLSQQIISDTLNGEVLGSFTDVLATSFIGGSSVFASIIGLAFGYRKFKKFAGLIK